jgi:hypothetical protein
MGMPVQVTLSSSGISRGINCDWMSGEAVAYTVSFSSSGTATWSVEASPNDLNQTSSANALWFVLSSGSANSSYSGTLLPIGGIRLDVASLSSALITLSILQGIGNG